MFPELPLTTKLTVESFNTMIGQIQESGRLKGSFLSLFPVYSNPLPITLFAEFNLEFCERVELFIGCVNAPRALFKKIPVLGRYTQLPPGLFNCIY
jgi:hypothetical protein